MEKNKELQSYILDAIKEYLNKHHLHKTIRCLEVKNK